MTEPVVNYWRRRDLILDPVGASVGERMVVASELALLRLPSERELERGLWLLAVAVLPIRRQLSCGGRGRPVEDLPSCC